MMFDNGDCALRAHIKRNEKDELCCHFVLERTYSGETIIQESITLDLEDVNKLIDYLQFELQKKDIHG